MDQQKIGAFLKELRKEKTVTQEQLAEILNVWFKVALISFAVYFVSLFAEPETPTAVFDFAQGLMLGIVLVMIIVGVLMTGKNGHKLQETKKRLLGKTGREE